MQYNMDTHVAELSRENLLAMGWKAVPTSCHCGHDEAWHAPCQYGDVSMGCTTCTHFYVIIKRDVRDHSLMTEREMAEDKSEHAVVTTGEALQAFWRENELDRDPYEVDLAVAKDYLGRKTS